MSDEAKKPPLGLRPRWSHDSERLREIREALRRYYNAQIVIPIPWIEEYNELVVKEKNKPKF